MENTYNICIFEKALKVFPINMKNNLLIRLSTNYEKLGACKIRWGKAIKHFSIMLLDYVFKCNEPSNNASNKSFESNFFFIIEIVDLLSNNSLTEEKF